MDAVKDFAGALTEVDALISMSRASASDVQRSVLIKASLLLLATKVECFLESIVEEYCEAACMAESAAHLPHALRVSASRKMFLDAKLQEEHRNGADTVRQFMAIAEIWGNKAPCPQVTIDCRFSYGRHGENEVIKLFRRVGIPDVFEQFPVDDENESFARPGGATSIAPDFNSMSSIRNNITHSDATPALTEADIERYKRRLVLFAGRLEDYLESTLVRDDRYHI